MFKICVAKERSKFQTVAGGRECCDEKISRKISIFGSRMHGACSGRKREKVCGRNEHEVVKTWTAFLRWKGQLTPMGQYTRRESLKINIANIS